MRSKPRCSRERRARKQKAKTNRLKPTSRLICREYILVPTGSSNQTCRRMQHKRRIVDAHWKLDYVRDRYAPQNSYACTDPSCGDEKRCKKLVNHVCDTGVVVFRALGHVQLTVQFSKVFSIRLLLYGMKARLGGALPTIRAF